MSNLEIMQKVQNGQMTAEEADKLLKTKTLKLKVSPKGAVQLDGLRRFPVTLYQHEWMAVLEMAPEIKQFIQENRNRLASKGE